MTTAAEAHHVNPSSPRRRLRLVQLILAGIAAIAMLALFDAARPDTTQTMIGSGSVRLTDNAFDVPAAASGPMYPRLPQAAPNLSGGRVIAADDDEDQEQQDLQQMQQSQQQAEEENEQAQQQAQLDEQLANQ